MSHRQHWICLSVDWNIISKQNHPTYRLKKSRLYLLKMAFGCKTLWTLWKLRKSWENLRLVPSGDKLQFLLVLVLAGWFVDPINLLPQPPDWNWVTNLSKYGSGLVLTSSYVPAACHSLTERYFSRSGLNGKMCKNSHNFKRNLHLLI